MALVITDEELSEAGLTDQEARLELACRLFDVGKLALWPAAKFAGMRRIEFEEELGRRKISVYRPTSEDLDREIEALERLGI